MNHRVPQQNISLKAVVLKHISLPVGNILTFWRRNYFFFILAHTLYKM